MRLLNHTLTQSSFEQPCNNRSGFDTGFQQFNPVNASGRFLVDYQVTTKDPQWFFCAQISPKSHCQSGMVFALNPGEKLDEFQSNVNGSNAPLVTPAPSRFCPAHLNSTQHNTSTQGFRATFSPVSFLPEFDSGGYQLISSILPAVAGLLLGLPF
ncbi:hypothetical protein M011DRAFT_514230 [Sporormia fimetaria CBS 119925]|uniref:Cupredoxin n=1 Tax=Sporormia fimetaria CBS 119925 TaxID=1340428 RepID=A0A6A6UTS9_9PLEO|nr:hypothetical protein M011DRAFT_514230 [Sporormia fimetaria CBS 119925]